MGTMTETRRRRSPGVPPGEAIRSPHYILNPHPRDTPDAAKMTTFSGAVATARTVCQAHCPKKESRNAAAPYQVYPARFNCPNFN